MTENKKKYVSPMLEVTKFDIEDIITTSGASSSILPHEIEVDTDIEDDGSFDA